MDGAEDAFVGLGANLGEAQQTLERAIQALRGHAHWRVVATSGLWLSAPQDAPGPDYVNAVVQLHTHLGPRQLWEQLQVLEQQFGRERPFRHAPRTLDLDLLLYGQQILREPDLTIPHPRLHLRAFVLEPLAEINPALEIPGCGSIQPWRKRASHQILHRVRSL